MKQISIDIIFGGFSGEMRRFIRRRSPGPILSAPIWVGVCLLVIFAAGCGKDRPAYRWNQQVLEAGQVQDQGDLARAEREYLALIDSAPSQDARRYILMELADISQRRGDWHQAVARYKQVYSELKDDEPGALALYRTGIIAGEHLADPERALRLRRETITRFPASVAAEFAARDHAKYYQTRKDYDAMVQDFDALLEQVRGEPVADNLLFEVAEVFRKAGRLIEALPYYRRVWTEYPDAHLGDVALWEGAQIYEHYQDWPAAIALYQRLANLIEKSWFMGDYNSPWANDARIRLGMIYMLHLEDYPEAKHQFDRYLDDFPDGLLTDDIAWDRVQVIRLIGGQKAFEQAMKEFAETYPESRYVRRIKRRLGQEGRP